jgi:hypothetical protein
MKLGRGHTANIPYVPYTWSSVQQQWNATTAYNSPISGCSTLAGWVSTTSWLPYAGCPKYCQCELIAHELHESHSVMNLSCMGSVAVTVLVYRDYLADRKCIFILSSSDSLSKVIRSTPALAA